MEKLMSEESQECPATLARSSDLVAALGRMRMLPGEDGSLFEAFRAQVMADVKPRDVIEQILVNEFVCQHWEALRWRRYKANLLNLASERTRERLAGPGGAASATDSPDQLIIGEMEVAMSGAFAAMLGHKLSLLERLDTLLESAEARRASALRDLHRHREALAQEVQQVARRIEEAEFRTLDEEDVKPLPAHEDERLGRLPAVDDERLKK
jgi:hypothetical protein